MFEHCFTENIKKFSAFSCFTILNSFFFDRRKGHRKDERNRLLLRPFAMLRHQSLASLVHHLRGLGSRFIARLESLKNVSRLCRSFGVNREVTICR